MPFRCLNLTRMGLGGGQNISTCVYRPSSTFTYHRLCSATRYLPVSARRVIVRRVGLPISTPCPRQRGTVCLYRRRGPVATRARKILSCCSLQEGMNKLRLSMSSQKLLNLTRMFLCGSWGV
jgi:hypothetical protein